MMPVVSAGAPDDWTLIFRPVNHDSIPSYGKLSSALTIVFAALPDTKTIKVLGAGSTPDDQRGSGQISQVKLEDAPVSTSTP